ncbi:MAG: hypothetical protein ACJA2B_001576 [Candidatus Endobugula sp.]|jgi:hypothetical protein
MMKKKLLLTNPLAVAASKADHWITEGWITKGITEGHIWTPRNQQVRNQQGHIWTPRINQHYIMFFNRLNGFLGRR